MTCWVYSGWDCQRGTPMKARQCHKTRAGGHNHTSFLPNRPLLTYSSSPHYESNSPDLGMSWPMRVMSLQVGQSGRGIIFCPRRKTDVAWVYVYFIWHTARDQAKKKTSLLGSCDNALCKKQTYIKLGASGGNLKANIGKFVGYYEHIKALI